MWALLNQYQLISLLPLFGTYFGKNFRDYITEFKFVLFNFDHIENMQIPSIDSHAKSIHYEQPNHLFDSIGLTSGSFIYNQYGLAKVFLIAFISNAIFWCVKLIGIRFKWQKAYIKKSFDLGTRIFYFALYIRIIIQASLFIFI